MKTLTEERRKPRAYSSISQPSTKILTLFFGGGYHLGEPCSSAPLGSVEGEKQVLINIQKALEYHEGGYHVSRTISPLQRMKAPSLQSLFVGEVRHACSQPCSLSLYGRYLQRGLANRLAYHIWDADALMPLLKDWMKYFERTWKERLIMKIIRLALFAASVHLSEPLDPWLILIPGGCSREILAQLW